MWCGVEEDDSNNKRLWRYLKGTRKDSCGVNTLAADGKIGTDPCTKAEMLNHQFSSVFTRENQTNIPIMNPSPYPEMPAIHVESNGVFKLLNQLNQCKANGPDNIPAVFLKTCSSELAKMLSFIIQQSLAKQTIPEDWRKALVTSAFKKGDRSNPENYRPISLTSICCKIAEHII